MYQERLTRSDGAVVWTRTVADQPKVSRILPDWCIDIIWSDGQLFVAGPASQAHLFRSRPNASLVGIRFAPGTAPQVLGVPALELLDRDVPLSALWRESAVRELSERIGTARDPATELANLVRPAEVEPWVTALVAGVRRGQPISRLATEVAFSERQLHRRSLPLFGYGPKMLSRVLRLERALHLARRGSGLAGAAAAAGYADQAHLARDAKALAGVPMTELLT